MRFSIICHKGGVTLLILLLYWILTRNKGYNKIPLGGILFMEKECCLCKKTKRDDLTKKKLINRLKRINGQIIGIINMIENDVYCNDILIQTSAVSSAVNSLNKEILSNHIRNCIYNDIRNGNVEVIDEFVDTLQNLLK